MQTRKNEIWVGVFLLLALLAALAIPGAAYYAIWAMAAVIFALAVYYTVKQL